MAFTHKQNTGSIFKNERKEKDSHPNMTGSALIGGIEYWVSAWTKEGDKGRWQSLSFTPKESRGARETAKSEPQQSRGGGNRDVDSDIPFAPFEARTVA